MEGFTSVEEAALKSDGGGVGLIGAKTMWRLGWDLFLFLKMNLALADEAALMSKFNLDKDNVEVGMKFEGPLVGEGLAV